MTDLLTFDDAVAVLDEMHLVIDDPGLFAAGVGRPAATVFGQDAYPDLVTKVAALADSIVRNHALVDGNKRAGWAFAIVTLWLNSYELDYDEDQAFEMVMSVSDGGNRLLDIALWFRDHIQPAH